MHVSQIPAGALGGQGARLELLARQIRHGIWQCSDFPVIQSSEQARTWRIRTSKFSRSSASSQWDNHPIWIREQKMACLQGDWTMAGVLWQVHGRYRYNPGKFRSMGQPVTLWQVICNSMVYGQLFCLPKLLQRENIFAQVHTSWAILSRHQGL